MTKTHFKLCNIFQSVCRLQIKGNCGKDMIIHAHRGQLISFKLKLNLKIYPNQCDVLMGSLFYQITILITKVCSIS